MAIKIETKNNFNIYKSDFKKDTGLDAEHNMALYINYVTARTNDTIKQLFPYLMVEVSKLKKED